MRLLIRNDIREIERIADACQNFGEENGLSEKMVFDANLILEEIISNIIFYGYDDENEHEIVLEMNLDGENLKIRIQDDAKPFNPLESRTPDLDLPLEDRPIGGLGIYLTHKLVDNMEYKRTDGKNILTLNKTIE